MFDVELGYIKNPKIKKIATLGVEILPDYFWHVPASSSGKYHPAYAVVSDGGLYNHVRAAVRIAKMNFRCEAVFNFNQDEQDIIIASLILHDGMKQGIDGSGGHTLFEHPVLMSEYMLELLSPKLDDEENAFMNVIRANIECHMGQWNTDPYGKSSVVLPLPRTKMEKFVHLCDYLASRKPLEYNFEVPVV